MERIIQFTPAFDKRSDDPDKNFGIGSMLLKFILKGKFGATQFVIMTNWHLVHVIEQIPDLQKINGSYPLPMDVGYHSYVPISKYQENPVSFSCEYLDGQPCYYDGSSMAAENLYKKFIAEGDKVVWEYLEKYYFNVFKDLIISNVEI